MDLLNFFLYTSAPSFIEKVIWAIAVAVGFSILFNVPKRALLAIGVLGGIGFSTRFLMLMFFPDQLVFATLVAASLIGLLGTRFAHIAHTPPAVLTIPAVINIIPGKPGYEFMLSLIRLVSMPDDDPMRTEVLMQAIDKCILTGFLLACLAFGVAFSILILNIDTVKDKKRIGAILKSPFQK